MPCVIVLPDGANVVEGAPSELGAPPLVGPSYVEAVTDGSDATYIQQQAAATDFAYINWDLPATSIPYAGLVSIEVVTRLAYDPTPINGRTSVQPGTITRDATARLRYPGDTDSLAIGWAVPMPETVTAYEGAFNIAIFASEAESWIDALAAGTAQLETRQGGDSIGRCTRHNIYELALRICYEGVNLSRGLRQRQRDDFRQRQRESRQLSPRVRSYI